MFPSPSTPLIRISGSECTFLLSGYVRGILAELCPIATPPFAHSSSIDFLMQRRLPTGPRSQWQGGSKRSMRFCPDRVCLTVWMPHGGATAVLRAACHTTVAQGERAVWIDGLGTVAGPFWEEGPILVRPRSRKHGLRGAEELLRCGGFALIVIAGIEPEGTETVRLSRAAREGGGALVALTAHASMASLRVTSQILCDSDRG